MEDENYDYQLLNDNKYESLLYTIISTSNVVAPKANMSRIMFQDEVKLCDSNNQLEFLKAVDYSNVDIFELNSKFELAINRWTDKIKTASISTQLSKCNLYSDRYDFAYNASPMRSIDNMVEATYYYDRDKKFNIAEEICYLRMLAFKWRSISGDGNCFYRSVMYSYLENIIMRNDITTLQRMIVDLDEKFDEGYINTKILNKEVRKILVELDRRLIITILKIIFDILDSGSSQNSILSALNILTKSFNYSKSFDIAMVLYLRYKLYEFILENKDKYFSNDFPVKLGNLLPFQYETDQGDFLYSKFFNEELLKLYTYAEKIAIYLTPFVLNINLRIIFYDYGKDCNIQTKDFNCYLDNKESLMILYRKAHYDIAYSKDYVDKYCKFLNHFVSFKDDLRVVDESLINYYRLNEVGQVDLSQSKIFNKKDKDKSLTNVNTTVDSIESQDDKIKNLMDEKERLEKRLMELEKKESIRLPCGCFLYEMEKIKKFADKFMQSLNLNNKQSKFMTLSIFRLINMRSLLQH
jgi:hypothetical protein